jgi:hypothetical protein
MNNHVVVRTTEQAAITASRVRNRVPSLMAANRKDEPVEEGRGGCESPAVDGGPASYERLDEPLRHSFGSPTIRQRRIRGFASPDCSRFAFIENVKKPA